MSSPSTTVGIGNPLLQSRSHVRSHAREGFLSDIAGLSGQQRQDISRAGIRESAERNCQSEFFATVSDRETNARLGSKRILAIGAHPDDVEIGCGGALAKHRAMGDEIRILTLSRGAVGGDTDIRVHEASRAACILGASLELADLPDTRISDGIATIEIIQPAVRLFAPTHVYTHSCHDAHQDHRGVHAASIVATRGVNNVYAYQSPSSTVDFRPNHFVDVAGYIDKKIEALGAHESQVRRSASLQLDFVVATALYWGRYLGHTMVEPMEVIHQLDI